MDCDLTDLHCSPSGTAEPGPVELVPGVWLSTLARSRDPAKRSWFVLWGSGSCSQCPPPQHCLYFPGPAWIRQPGPKKRARGSGGERWGDTSLGRPWGSGNCYGCFCSLTRGQQGAGWGGLPAEGPGHNCCLPQDTHTDCGLSFLQHSEITIFTYHCSLGHLSEQRLHTHDNNGYSLNFWDSITKSSTKRCGERRR